MKVNLNLIIIYIYIYFFNIFQIFCSQVLTPNLLAKPPVRYAAQSTRKFKMLHILSFGLELDETDEVFVSLYQIQVADFNGDRFFLPN